MNDKHAFDRQLAREIGNLAGPDPGSTSARSWRPRLGRRRDRDEVG